MDKFIIAFFALIASLVIAIVYVAIDYENEHPCIKYGEKELAFMQQVGSSIIPVYKTPCLERKQ